MTCAVFGASVLSTASCQVVLLQVSEGINTTTSEMKGKSIDGDNGLIKTVVNVLFLGCRYFVCYYDYF